MPSLVTDADRYDELQPWFVARLIADTKHHLEQAGLSGEELKSACASVVFSFCTLLDNSASFEADNEEYVPYLVFSKDENTMFYPGGNSYLHEYVYGVLDEVFAEQGGSKG